MRSVGRMVRGVGLGGLWLGMAGVFCPVLAQALNNVVRPATDPNVGVFVPPAGLASGYTITIHSDWNRADVMHLCAVKGGESITGRLTWTGVAYVGVLRRESSYTECGVHGPEMCTVNVVGSGDVQVAGEVTSEAGGPLLDLRWSPARDTEVTVEGSCPARYRRALAQMYRTVTHAASIPLPKAGGGEISLALEAQPWKVQVSP